MFGSPAAAVGAPPVPKVALPAAIDNPSFYEKQRICQSVARPGALALKQALLDAYGPATVYITRACSGSVSEHFDGRAVDWMRNVRVPAEREQAEAFLAWALAPGADGTPMEMARRMGIMYLIWNNRMIRTYDAARGWTNYRGCMAAGMSRASLDNSCHRNHIHISMSWDGAAGLTSWWTGSAITAPYCSTRSTSGAKPAPGTPQVVADLGAVPGLKAISPVPVLDTSTGVGLPGPCRLLAGRALPVPVLPAIAGTDARAVALQVTARSNAPARLSAWSSGRTQPTGQVELAIATPTTTTLLVPVSSAGTIGLATSLGAAELTVSVVGYLTEDLAGGGGGSQFEPPGRGQAATPLTVTPATATTTPKPSTATVSVTGVKASKPQAVRARASRGAVAISWAAPKATGTHPILGYRVAALLSPTQTNRVAGTCVADPQGSSCTITGLKKGRTYWMSLRVTTAVGATWASKVRVRAK